MSFLTKNPGHPSSLTVNDMRPGRRISIINNDVVLGEAIITSRPYISEVGGRKELVIDMRTMSPFATAIGTLESFTTITRSLDYMGVIPRHNAYQKRDMWYYDVFVIDSRKRHLLQRYTIEPEELTDAQLEEAADYLLWVERLMSRLSTAGGAPYGESGEEEEECESDWE